MSTVRAARAEDIERVAEIETMCFPNPWARDALASEMERSWARVLVAEHDGEIVAFVNYWLVADEIHVLNVATDPTHRRQGHARALIEVVMRSAREGNTRVVLLEVRATNVSAIALYSSMGFVQTGLRPRYYDDGEDALLMNAELFPRAS